MNEKKVVTRFAPSPTGFMHVGGIRTALYAYLWAKKNKGTFILRIEDTDKEREVKGSLEHIIESLKWLGINWDEGPHVGGPHSPYLQSERLDLYKKYAQILIDKGLAYPDPYTEEEVGVFRNKAELEKKPFLYREHRPDLPAQAGKFYKWDNTKPLRFKVPEIKSYKWNDLVYGDLSAGPEALDDFILIKSDGYPTYNFAHIVDDIEMGVTHVMRGQEFISSTPKFLSIYEALNIKPPLFATLPPIMADDGKKKLGKRDGAKDILEYRNEGYLPEAIINFLALLGWNPGDDREIFTMDELIKAFDISRIGHSGAQMNLEKLDWFSKKHMKLLSLDKYLKIGINWVPKEYFIKNGLEKTQKDLILMRDSIIKFSDITKKLEINNKKLIVEEKGEYKLTLNSSSFEKAHYVPLKESDYYEIPRKNKQKTSFTEENHYKFSPKNEFYYLLDNPIYNYELLVWKDLKNDSQKFNKTLEYLEKVLDLLKSVDEKSWTYELLKNSNVWTYAEIEGRGNVLWPIRVALSGQERSPDPFKLAETLGKDVTLKRINEAIIFLKKIIINEINSTNSTKTIISGNEQ